MATYFAIWIALFFLILTATQRSSAEVKNESRVQDEGEECSQPQLREQVEAFLSNRNWLPLRRRLEAVLDRESDAYRQATNLEFWPMYRIGRRGYVQLASLLMCAGLPVDTPDRDGDTMLHGAASDGRLQMVQLLLTHGADVDSRGIGRTTPLIRAAEYGHLEVVRALVQAGANTTLEEVNGRTALYKARSHRQAQVVEYLGRLAH